MAERESDLKRTRTADTAAPAVDQPIDQTPKPEQKEEPRDPQLTYPAPPKSKEFNPDGTAKEGSDANREALKAREEILKPTEERKSFEQIEAERAAKQDDPKK